MMADSKILEAVDQSIQNSVGVSPDAIDVGVPIIPWLASAASMVPPWWSFARDSYLRNFWKRSSHLALMVYTGQNMLVNTPMTVVPKDPTIVSHVEQAEMLTYMLMNVSEFGESLIVAKSRFVEDILTQDNGGFMEVIGPGDPKGPIEGLPQSVRHLDSRYCWRTGHRVYPVVYHDPNDGGKAYMLHRTRVVYMSQMTSAIAEMNGVGFCAVSRSLQFAQHLYDIMIHKQEKLGSRPISQIIVGSGFRGSHIMQAVSAANQAMNNQNLARYGRVIGIGSDDVNAKLDTVSLNNFDPFDEETSVTFAMYGLAAAFGIPIQEVWPTASGKSGRGGDLQDSRQRGKLPAEFHSNLDLQVSQKYLPPHLKMVSDWSDDYQDEREAINEDIRARNRERDIGSETITVRTARKRMVDVGDLDRDEFRILELESGRLENGAHLRELFYREEEPYSTMLAIGVPNPTSIRVNDKMEMLEKISEQEAVVLAALAQASSRRERGKLEESLAAIKWLEEEYDTYEEPVTFEEMALAPGNIPNEIHDQRVAAGEIEEEEEDNGPKDGNMKPNAARDGTLVKPQNPKSLQKQSSIDDLLDELEDDLEREFRKDEPSESRLKEIVLLAFLSAFLFGAEMEEGDLTEDHFKTIIASQEQFVEASRKMVERRKRGNDMKATTLRVLNRAKHLFWEGYVVAEGKEDTKETWVLGPTKVHCGDCGSFAGETRTRKEWKDGGKLPQSGSLECTGLYCLCSLKPA
jgi:hypothetical protein